MPAIRFRFELRPVPDDLGRFLSSAPDTWRSADGRPETDAATAWHGDHRLYTGYLRAAPAIRWWRSAGEGDDVMTVAWRHRPGDDIAFTAPERGQVTVPTSAFVTAVREFDNALLIALEQRIAELERSGSPAGVHIDMAHHRAEQEDRATWLRRAWVREYATDWAAVRAGVRGLEGRSA